MRNKYHPLGHFTLQNTVFELLFFTAKQFAERGIAPFSSLSGQIPRLGFSLILPLQLCGEASIAILATFPCFTKYDQYYVAGPRLWAQPINLPFQLFPNDSENDSSKTTYFGQQSEKNQFGAQQNFLQQPSYYPSADQGHFFPQQSFQQKDRSDSQSQKIDDLANMFGRTSLNKWNLRYFTCIWHI